MSEQARKRQENLAAILLNLHYGGEMQRSQLSKLCNIRKSSVTNLIAELLEKGLIAESVPGSIRSPILIAGGSSYAIASMVTAHEIITAVVELDGTVSREEATPLGDNTPDAVVAAIGKAVRHIVKSDPRKPAGAAISIPGAVDPSSGKVLRAVNLSDWQDVDLGSMIEEKLRLPVIVNNDYRCQLWAHAWFDREIKKADNLLYVGIGEGVACATMMHGRRIEGHSHTAGEIGHVKGGSENRRCKCGKLDCVETYCSIPAICEEVSALPNVRSKPSTAADIASLGAELPAVANVLDRLSGRLAAALAPIMAAIDPECLLIGSPSPEFSAMLCEPLQRHIRGELLGLNASTASILPAMAMRESTLRGAGGLVIEKLFKNGGLPF
ncbi:MAG: ROK family transcriptional regulator [Planctomycetes bacterium]|nr:ROK family transcriptional regulator [Planctomycetota bacterium]